MAEVRTLTEAAVKKGVVTQLGTQLASNNHSRTAVNWLKEGRIGKITHAYLCSNRPGAIEKYRLNDSDFADHPGTFKTFNEFFYRKLKPLARPVDPDRAAVVFPADGRHLGLPAECRHAPRGLALAGVRARGLTALLQSSTLRNPSAGAER